MRQSFPFVFSLFFCLALRHDYNNLLWCLHEITEIESYPCFRHFYDHKKWKVWTFRCLSSSAPVYLFLVHRGRLFTFHIRVVERLKRWVKCEECRCDEKRTNEKRNRFRNCSFGKFSSTSSRHKNFNQNKEWKRNTKVEKLNDSLWMECDEQNHGEYEN